MDFFYAYLNNLFKDIVLLTDF